MKWEAQHLGRSKNCILKGDHCVIKAVAAFFQGATRKERVCSQLSFKSI